VQKIGDQPAHGSLARAHETDEREIGRWKRVVHGDELAENGTGRTPQIGCGHPFSSPFFSS
jgi:hypothetical protein